MEQWGPATVLGTGPRGQLMRLCLYHLNYDTFPRSRNHFFLSPFETCSFVSVELFRFYYLVVFSEAGSALHAGQHAAAAGWMEKRQTKLQREHFGGKAARGRKVAHRERLPRSAIGRQVRSRGIWISVRICISVSFRKSFWKIVKHFCNLKNIAS